MKVINNIYNFKLLKDSVYFKIMFLLWALFHTLSFGPRFTGYLSPLFIIWGGLLIIKNVFIERNRVPKVLTILIWGFLLSYVVTIGFNMENNLVGNVKTLIWAAIMMLVLFYTEDVKNKVFKDIWKISNVIVIVTMIISIISIVMFSLDVCYFIERVDGKLIPQGYYAARLWGVYVDPNQACTIGIISLVSSILVILQSNKRYITVINVTNIIIQYIFIVLTGSRGGEISLIFIFIGVGYLIFDRMLNRKIRGISGRTVLSLILATIITVAIILSFQPSRKILSYIPRATLKTQEYINETTGIKISEGSGNVTVQRPDVGGEGDISNGRITLWVDGLKLSKHSPILGFGDRNITLKAGELTPGSSLEKQFVHNGFIHMLLSGGIIAVVIMLAIIFIIAIRAITIVFGRNRFKKEYYLYSIIAFLVGALLITAVFLTEIFYQNSFIATIYWILLGSLVAIDGERVLN